LTKEETNSEEAKIEDPNIDATTNEEVEVGTEDKKEDTKLESGDQETKSEELTPQPTVPSINSREGNPLLSSTYSDLSIISGTRSDIADFLLESCGLLPEETQSLVESLTRRGIRDMSALFRENFEEIIREEGEKFNLPDTLLRSIVINANQSWIHSLSDVNQDLYQMLMKVGEMREEVAVQVFKSLFSNQIESREDLVSMSEEKEEMITNMMIELGGSRSCEKLMEEIRNIRKSNKSLLLF